MPQLAEQRECIRQVASEHELGVLPQFDARLKEVEQAHHIVRQTVLAEQTADLTHLCQRQGETSIAMTRVGRQIAPVEVQIRRLVITR